ncbi:MAG: hypothetical protein J1F11_05010, partial [Oscillospiraceae bacterium]|nr:hypothetical protein [Oscillospiraceae bacterium]
LYNEIIYIDKIGQVKKFITYDDYDSRDVVVAWLNGQISQNEDAELIDEADIHTLIEFYNTLTCIDPNSKLQHWGGPGLCVEFDRHYWFRIFGVRSDGGKNSYEALEISAGDAGYYSIQHNYIDKYDSHGVLERKDIDKYGRDTFDLYLKLDPFMIKGGGGSGNLVGEGS